MIAQLGIDYFGSDGAFASQSSLGGKKMRPKAVLRVSTAMPGSLPRLTDVILTAIRDVARSAGQERCVLPSRWEAVSMSVSRFRRTTTMALTVQHVHLKAHNVEKTIQYYIENFSATVKSEMVGRGWQLDLHGLQLNITGIISEQNHAQYYGIEHMAVVTDDYPATIAKLRSNGVEILEELTGGSGARVAFVSAPDGAQMEVIEKA